MRTVIRVLGWIGSHERTTLVALTLLGLAGWGFAETADFVIDGESRALDERILLSMRTTSDPNDPLGPPWVEELARDITSLGGLAFLTLMTLAATGFLLLQRKSHLALYLVLVVSTGALASQSMKSLFDRARPDLVAHGQAVFSSSFPSGHSMMSTLVFFTVGALLASALTSRRLKAYVLVLAALLAVIVGATRVYLGVHWPTDVLAGWTAGCAWALLCWILADFLKRRGSVESG
jgi:undecaprenyl-diphosphatase